MDNYKNYENSYADDLTQGKTRNPPHHGYSDNYGNYSNMDSRNRQNYHNTKLDSFYHNQYIVNSNKISESNSQNRSSYYYNTDKTNPQQTIGITNETGTSSKYGYDGAGYSGIGSRHSKSSLTYTQAPQLYKKDHVKSSNSKSEKKFIGPVMPKPKSGQMQNNDKELSSKKEPSSKKAVPLFYREAKAIENEKDKVDDSHDIDISSQNVEINQYNRLANRPESHNPYSEISKKIINAKAVKNNNMADGKQVDGYTRDRPMQPMPSFGPRHSYPPTRHNENENNPFVEEEAHPDMQFSPQDSQPENIQSYSEQSSASPVHNFPHNVNNEMRSHNFPNRMPHRHPSHTIPDKDLSPTPNQYIRSSPHQAYNRMPSPHQFQYERPLPPQDFNRHKDNIRPPSHTDRMHVPVQSRMVKPSQIQSHRMQHPTHPQQIPYNQPMQNVPMNRQRMPLHEGQRPRYPSDHQPQNVASHPGYVRHPEPEQHIERIYSELEERHVKQFEIEKLIDDVDDIEKVNKVSTIVKELNVILPIGHDAKINIKDKELIYNALDQIRDYFENHLKIKLRKEISKYGFQGISSNFVSDAPNTMCEIESDDEIVPVTRQYKPAHMYSVDSDSDTENLEHLVDGKYYTVWIDKINCHNICMQRLSVLKNARQLEFNGFKPKHQVMTTDLDSAFVIRPEQWGSFYGLVHKGTPCKVPSKKPGAKSDVIVMKVRLKKPKSNAPGLPEHLCYLDFFEWNCYVHAGRSKTVIALLEDNHPFQPRSNSRHRKRHRH